MKSSEGFVRMRTLQGVVLFIFLLIAGRLAYIQLVDSKYNELAKANVLRNNLQDRVEVRRVDVTTPGRDPRFSEGFDLMAASEILYLDDLHRPLLKFVDRHLAPGGKALFCTDLARAKPHFTKLAAKSFKLTEGRIGVKSRDEDGEEQRRIYSILILERA